MEICCILSLNYDDISKIYPFALDFEGCGSTLVEMKSGDKHIINENGDITYTLNTEEYDDVSFGSKGCYLVHKAFSGYDNYGTHYGIIGANGEIVLPLSSYGHNMSDVGSGVVAFSTQYGPSFYNAKTDTFFEIEGLTPNFLMLNSGDIFVDGVARVELGSGRMLDPVALTYADTGNTIELDIQTEYAFYGYGPISDGGFIYYSYSYEGNRGDIVSSIRFYDLKTGESVRIFDDPERIKYNSSLQRLKFVDGYVAIELLGADRNTYYCIVNKSGQTVFGPQKDISSVINMGEGYFSIGKAEGTEIINLNGKEALRNDLQISAFSNGYAVADYGRCYIDADGNELTITLPE